MTIINYYGEKIAPDDMVMRFMADGGGVGATRPDMLASPVKKRRSPYDDDDDGDDEDDENVHFMAYYGLRMNMVHDWIVDDDDDDYDHFCHSENNIDIINNDEGVLQVANAQFAAAAGMLELAQSFGFNLANTFAGHAELLAHFFQRVI